MQVGFNLLELEDIEQEDIGQVLKELTTTCTDCRLSQLHPYNRGVIYRGNPLAKIAVVGIAPGDTETEKGIPLIGASGKEFEKWMTFIGVDTAKDVFITNVIQCQPPKTKKSGDKLKQRDPDKDELNACFGPRCLRILRAMPNLEIVMTLGWVPAKSFLGTSNDENVPKTKTHEGGWFETSLLPGKAIFCLSHPAELLYTDSPEKRMTIQKFLGYFRREALIDKKIMPLAKMTQEDREAKGLGLL